MRHRAQNQNRRAKIHHLSNVQYLPERQIYHKSVSVRGVGNQWGRRTPLDPDSGPRSSQTKTEPGRIQSRLSMLVSRLVIRGKIFRATASKMMWLSRVFRTRTSVNVGPCILSRVFGYEVCGEGKSEPEALLYVGCIKAGGNVNEA